jgi:hypothetical protein
MEISRSERWSRSSVLQDDALSLDVVRNEPEGQIMDEELFKSKASIVSRMLHPP